MISASAIQQENHSNTKSNSSFPFMKEL